MLLKQKAGLTYTSFPAVHLCTSPVAPNARVLAEVDWSRRHDLCTQHTSQHLLSAVLEHHYDLPTLGWALSVFPNLNYVELPRCPSKEELVAIERICNELIIEGRRVRIEMELSQNSNRPDTLPVDYIGGEFIKEMYCFAAETLEIRGNSDSHHR